MTERNEQFDGNHGSPLALILSGLLACLLLAAPLRADDTVFPQGSNVGLVPPHGMSLSEDFTGFMNPSNGTSIMISALPAVAYDQIVAGMTSEALAAKGLALTGDCPTAKPTFESTCIRAAQQAMEQGFQKWILIVRFANETSIVVATVPDAALAGGDYSMAEIDAALATLAYSSGASVSRPTTLPFTIEEGELLSFQQILGGSAALYAAVHSTATPQPIWVVASSLGPEPLAETVEFSRSAFFEIASIEEPEILGEQPFKVNQLNGHVLEGRARDESTGATLYVFQALLADAGGKYYRMVGLTPTETQATFRAEFLRLARTLRPR